MTDTDQRQQVLAADQAKAVSAHVARRVNQVQRMYLPESGGPPTSDGAATLALLRRGASATGAVDPRVWGFVLQDLPQELEVLSPYSVDFRPSRAELAILAALTTYAQHQQSKRAPVHVPGVGLGAAVRALARERAKQIADPVGGMDDRVVQRLHRVMLAQTHERRVDALRALIQLTRSADQPIGLDYGRLASDLFWMQFGVGRSRVQLAWGRDLYRGSNPGSETKEPPESDDTDTDNQ